MKKQLTILAFSLLIPSLLLGDDDLWESKGPHVRIKRNNYDGSHVVFRRTPDDKKLTKITKDKDNNVMMTAVYYRNDRGFLTAGQIYDGQGVHLYRVRYGYHPKTGYLIAEEMFDARVKFEVPDEDGKMKELAVRRIYYFYDDEGHQSKAISLVSKDHGTAKDLFKQKGRKDTDLYNTEKFDPDKSFRPDKDNPFEKDKKKRR